MFQQWIAVTLNWPLALLIDCTQCNKLLVLSWQRSISIKIYFSAIEVALKRVLMKWTSCNVLTPQFQNMIQIESAHKTENRFEMKHFRVSNLTMQIISGLFTPAYS